jgi:hypothetical protein
VWTGQLNAGTGCVSCGPSLVNFTLPANAAPMTQLGAHTLIAVYGGDSTHETSQGTFTLTVTPKYSTTTALSCPATAAVGSGLQCMITVGDSPFTAGFVGQPVSISSAGQTLWTGSIGGTYGCGSCGPSYATVNLPANALPMNTYGVYSLVANYPGDSTHAASSSAPTTLTVVGVSTASSLSSDQVPANLSQQVNLKATISGSNPSGTVTFSDAGSVIGTVSITGGVAI